MKKLSRMLSLILLVLTSPMIVSYIVPNPVPPNANNQVRGEITMPNGRRGIGLGDGYQSRNQTMSAEKRRIDAANHPDKHVIVSLKPMDFQARYQPLRDVKITQREQTFIPPVLAITMGTEISIVNEDSEFHNVKSDTYGARFNIGRRPPGHIKKEVIKKSGLVKLGCDIHEHMDATILSFSTPYFTKVSPDGSFVLSNIPDGTYRLEAFHKNARKITREITVSGGEVQTLNLSF